MSLSGNRKSVLSLQREITVVSAEVFRKQTSFWHSGMKRYVSLLKVGLSTDRKLSSRALEVSCTFEETTSETDFRGVTPKTT